MSFSKAFRYPFQNIAKVLSIVLALTIAFAVFLGLLLNSHDWSPLVEQFNHLDADAHEQEFGELEPMGATVWVGILGLLVVAALSGFWISGYSVEVLRSIWNEAEYLPAIEFARNLKAGFYLFLSSVMYGALFIALLVVEILLLQATSSLGAISALLGIAAVAVTAMTVAVMGWAYLVGMARFAAEGDHRAVYQIRRNMLAARHNWKKGVGLLVYMIVLSIIYNSIRSVVDGVFGGAAGMLGITLSIVLYFFFNLMQHFSTQHLIAQYAVQIGIGGGGFASDKDKVDYA